MGSVPVRPRRPTGRCWRCNPARRVSRRSGRRCSRSWRSRSCPTRPARAIRRQLSWTLYDIPVTAVTPPVEVDVAIAAKDGRTYIALLQTDVDEAAALHDAVFLPVLDALAPLAAAVASPIDVPYTSEEVTFPGGAPGRDAGGHAHAPRAEPPDRRGRAAVRQRAPGPRRIAGSHGPDQALRAHRRRAHPGRRGRAALRRSRRGQVDRRLQHGHRDRHDRRRRRRGGLPGRPARHGPQAHRRARPQPWRHRGRQPRRGRPAGRLRHRHGCPGSGWRERAGGADGGHLAKRGCLRGGHRASPPSPSGRCTWPREMATGRPRRRPCGRSSGLSWDSLPEAQTAGQDRAAWIDCAGRAAAGDPQERRVPLAAGVRPRCRLGARDGAGAGHLRQQGRAGRGCAERRRRSRPLSRRPATTTRRCSTIPGANHLFQAATSGSVAEYASLPSTFAPDFLAQLVPWVAAHATTP